MSSPIYSLSLRFITYVYMFFGLIVLFSCASESSSEMAKFALTQPVDAPIVELDQSVMGTFKTADSIILLSLSHAFNAADKKIGIHLAESNSRLYINKQDIINQLDGVVYAKVDSMSDELKARGSMPLNDFLISQLDTLVKSVCKHPFVKYDNPRMLDGSFYIHVNLIDTLFKVSSGQIIKKMGTDFYLNYQQSDQLSWKVLQLSPTAKGIKISSMSDEDAYVLRRLIKVRTSKASKTEVLNPDMKSFQSFVGMQGFENQVELERL